MAKPKDYYFMVLYDENNDDEPYAFGIVSKKFWKENKCLSDQDISNELEDILPKEFHEVQESHFEYHREGKTDKQNFKKGKSLLNSLGFTEIDNPF